MPRVLYINGDGVTSGWLAAALDDREFSVHTHEAPSEIGEALAHVQPDVVVISCSRPDPNTRQLCSGLRELSSVPIVVCAQSTREADIVAVFEAGADDYLVTPIRPVELTARLRAVLRRTIEAPGRHVQSEALVAGDVEVRVKEHKAYRRDVLVDLSPIEFRLLTVLVQEVGRAVSHSRLIASVWGPEYVDCRHYLRLYIKYLRSKVEDDPKDPKLIVSEWGVGYRFESANASW